MPKTIMKQHYSITGLHDYRPVTLTSVDMKWQATWRASQDNCSLQHSQQVGGWCCQHWTALHPATPKDLGLSSLRMQHHRSWTPRPQVLPACSALFTCHWNTSFLTDRGHQVKHESITPGTRTISISAPQGCVLSSPLHHDCTSWNTSVWNLWNTPTTPPLIVDGSLKLNVLKTQEMAVDARHRIFPQLTALSSWSGPNTSNYMWKKDQQRLYFLRQLLDFFQLYK